MQFISTKRTCFGQNVGYCYMVVIICGVYDNVLWLFLTVSWVGLECVTVLFPDHTHLLLEAMTNKEMILLHYLERIASV